MCVAGGGEGQVHSIEICTLINYHQVIAGRRSSDGWMAGGKKQAVLATVLAPYYHSLGRRISLLTGSSPLFFC